MSASWVIAEGSVDSTAFFRALPKHFPEATTLYVEGTTIITEAEVLYRSHAQVGPYLAPPQTLWPVSTKLRCAFSAELCEALASLSLDAAEPELADHISLYAGDSPILEWHDAFANAMYLAASFPEERVRSFADEFALAYHREGDG